MSVATTTKSKKQTLGQKFNTSVLLRCYTFLKPYWRYALGAYLGMVVIGLLNLTIPQFIRWIIDQGIDAGNRSMLLYSILGLIGLTLLKGVATFFQGRWTETASQSVAFDLRNAIQTKLTLLSFSFHDQSETGQLLSRAVQDVERIRFLTGRASLRVVDSAFLAVGTAVVLFSMNPRLALLVVLVLPLLAHRALYLGSRLRPLGVEIQNQLGVLTTRLEQNLRGMRVVKAFAQEESEMRKFERENSAWFKLSNRNARIQSINTPMLDLLANLGTVIIIWYGGTLAIRGELTLGELVAFTTYLGQLFNPIRMLGMIIPAIAMASASAERIFEILDAIPDVHNNPHAKILPAVTGRVQFEDVSFSYSGTRKVLENINLDVQPGQIIALLGATGSGKSTITNLIPRFYDPTQGRILIDGHDISQVTLQSLRSQIAMVLQETTLFIGTIQENIAFGRQDATQEQIIEAARAAQAHDFIAKLPHTYETHVGERGVTLSGGQKQRIALARALLTDPRILILDDATASVDTETERMIQKALDLLMENRTTFVIAHRLSTVRRADLILVLEKGKVVASGTHQQLLTSSPLYAEVYSRQLRPENGASAELSAASPGSERPNSQSECPDNASHDEPSTHKAAETRTHSGQDLNRGGSHEL
jgi:ATP-binding cassette, subfamily B, multidrug efflux pump